MNSNKFKSVRSKPQSFGGSVTSVGKMSGVILQRQKWIVNYYIKKFVKESQ